MDFELTERALQLSSLMWTFMREEVFPAEKVYAEKAQTFDRDALLLSLEPQNTEAKKP